MRRPGYLGNLEDTWFGGLGMVMEFDTYMTGEKQDRNEYLMAGKYSRSRGYRGHRLTPPVVADPAYSNSHPTYKLMYMDQKYRNMPITKRTPVEYITPPGQY